MMAMKICKLITHVNHLYTKHTLQLKPIRNEYDMDMTTFLIAYLALDSSTVKYVHCFVWF